MTMSDGAGPSKLLAGVGALLLAGTLAAGGYSLYGYRSVTETEAALRLAQQALSGLNNPNAMERVDTATQALRSSHQGAGSLPSGAATALGEFTGPWGSMLEGLKVGAENGQGPGAIEKAHLDADALRMALREALPAMQRLEQRMSGISALGNVGRDSLARLQTYADGGISLTSARRIDYDIRNLSQQLRAAADAPGASPELRGLRTDFEAVAQKVATPAAAASASVGRISREAWSSFQGAAGQASGRVADDIKAVSSTAGFFGAIGTAALAAGGAGLIALFASLLLTMRSFSARFSRSSVQFRRNEAAIEQLAQELEKASDLLVNDPEQLRSISPVPGMDTRSLQALESFNELVSRARENHRRVSKAAMLLVEQGKGAEQELHALRASVAKELTGAQGADLDLDRAARRGVRVITDVASASHAVQCGVEIAHNGLQAVQGSVETMDTIRESIQETSKRIKAVGERSQEIVEVVDLLDTISEQTNVLAMNASLEAERAGELGHGFNAVAAEVRRLSSRTEDALERISALVRSMQSETREAMAAMERSTATVVGGAYVTEIAGVSLSGLKSSLEMVSAMLSRVQDESREQEKSTMAAKAHLLGIGQAVRGNGERLSGIEEALDNVRNQASEIGTSLSLTPSRTPAGSR
jgi:twitching motility protein PilJ